LDDRPKDTAGLFLIAAVAYRFGDGEAAGNLSRLVREMGARDLDRLVENAAYHELEPLLHLIGDDCSRLGSQLDLPPELAARWSQVHEREIARCTIIHHGAVKALSALADAGVRAVPLKGFTLASRYYDRKSARSYKDLDLLVEPGALADMNRALLEAGFRPAPQRPAFVPAPAYTVYSLPMEGSDTAMEIDIHIGMHWPAEYETRTRFDSGDLWSQASPGEVEDLPAWHLSLEHLVITTLLDAAVNHRYARLIKFRDVIEVLRAAEVDGDEVERWCRLWEVRSFAGPGLSYLSGMDPSLSLASGVLSSMLPTYATMKAFMRSLPLPELPDHRSRSFSLPNLLFFVLADTQRERARGLLSLPGHMFRGRKRF